MNKFYKLLLIILIFAIGFSVKLYTQDVQAKEKKWKKEYTKFLKKKDIGVISLAVNEKKTPILIGKKYKNGNYQITFYKFIKGKVKKIGRYNTQYEEIEVYKINRNRFMIYDGQGSSVYSYVDMKLNGKKMKKTIWSSREMRNDIGEIIATYYKNGKKTSRKKFYKAIKHPTYGLEFHRPEF